MPTYEYRCKDCGEQLEVVQAFTDDALDTCPSCSGRLKKVFGSVGISFKGTGFYKTDSRGSSTSSGAGSSNGEGSSSSTDSSTSDTPAKSTSSDGTSGGSKSSSDSSGSSSSTPSSTPPSTSGKKEAAPA